MVEVQAHGFSFEKWVRDTFFKGYSGSYGQKWDIPSHINITSAIPSEFHHLPVSIKTAKLGSPINLGDALRQRQVDSRFVMIVGFWRQRTTNEKWFEEIGVVQFSPDTWNTLWGDLTLNQIQAIDREIKDPALPFAAARQRAREWKRLTPEVRTSSLILNPKIDSKVQRRLQCSLPFGIFWQQTGRAPAPQDSPALFGRSFLNPILSSARRFKP